MDQVKKPKCTIHEATYALLRRLTDQLEPVSQLMAESSETAGYPQTLDILIDLLRQTVAGIERLHVRIDDLESRLDEAAAAKALKSAIRS